MPSRITLVSLLIVALIVIGLRLLHPSDIAQLADKAFAPAGSDYFMRDATIYQMDAAGQLEYRMQLAEAVHHPNESANLTDIRVHYNTGPDSYWILQAAHGRIPPGDSRDLHLTGGVTLHQPDPQGPIANVKTDNAWLRTQTNLIETQAHVVAWGPGNRTEGDGMLLQLDDDRLKLYDNVESSYTP
ncbi:MAG TPA: LPS export ABC transporter periplasmic protein LptC [Salinisphaeraceae bacterium]|nr:LPS export ABC transporter periplasmic protein LptC [Salinisphaeraceae bacterium]